MTPFDLSLNQGNTKGGAMRLASVPTDPDWEMLREMMSQNFTASVDRPWAAY